MNRPLDIVGLTEIADLLGVDRGTPRIWRYRGIMPEPDGWVSGYPAWRRSSIVKWARDTGRGKTIPDDG